MWGDGGDGRPYALHVIRKTLVFFKDVGFEGGEVIGAGNV
jgi:hypothetical protein